MFRLWLAWQAKVDCVTRPSPLASFANFLLSSRSPNLLIVIPLVELEQWLPELWTTSLNERWYWHIAVIDKEGPKLSLTKPASPIDLSRFVLR